jgi:membrane-associated phospholipid phosphatase
VWLFVGSLSVALALLGISVAGAQTPSEDLSASRWIQAVDLPFWRTALETGEFLTGFPSGPLIWLTTVVSFWITRHRLEAVIVGVSLGIWVPKTIIKAIVASPRPSDDLVAIHELNSGFGFPSGHMTGGIAFWGMFAIVAVVLLRPAVLRLLVSVAASSVLTLASLNRVATGAHWPSDVVGSFLLGAIWLIGLTVLYLGFRDRSAALAVDSPGGTPAAGGAGRRATWHPALRGRGYVRTPGETDMGGPPRC